jgi:predicted phage terminase large subunit-like protein
VSDLAADLAPLAAAELARRRLTDFAALLVPGYERAAHLNLLADHLEALERRKIARLLIQMPPRHGKTLHVSQALPAWWLGRHPADSVILASYATELAEANSRRARGFLLDPRWPFPDVRVSPESSAVGRWNTTDRGGLIAAGVGGGLTGFGADLLVVDDPVKDRAEADSEAVRESVWKWWTEVALTRLQPGAVVLLTMTRWHEDDLAGRILASPGADEWTALSLAALADEQDPLGREEGHALWESWFPADRLAALRAEIGTRAFLALYQQTPTSEEGSTFRREWLDGRYAEVPRAGLRIVAGVDSSFGKGVASDFSAIVTVGADDRFLYVLDAARGRWEFSDLLAAIRREAAEWTPAAVLVEDSASGQSAVQELRRSTQLPLVPVRPLGSKVARAESVSPLFEAGRVLFPAQALPWRDELVEELAAFPTGRHDDMTDALVYALDRLRSSGTGRPPVVGGVPLERDDWTVEGALDLGYDAVL